MKLFYRNSGEGMPLIILHGLFGMSDNWMTLSKQFAENGFSVYVPDARNHGRSPWSDDFSYNIMADDILELMDNEHFQQTYIIGHSMGGKTAMFFACRYPEKVTKLIIADIAPKEYPSQNKNVIDAINSIDLSSIKSRKEVESKLSETLDNSSVQFLLKNLYWNSNESGEHQLAWRFNFKVLEKNMQRMEESLPKNYHFDKPTLFLKGEHSPYIGADDTDLIKRHFPKAIVETIPNVGHWIHADNPSGFMKSALRFLKSRIQNNKSPTFVQ